MSVFVNNKNLQVSLKNAPTDYGKDATLQSILTKLTTIADNESTENTNISSIKTNLSNITDSNNNLKVSLEKRNKISGQLLTATSLNAGDNSASFQSSKAVGSNIVSIYGKILSTSTVGDTVTITVQQSYDNTTFYDTNNTLSLGAGEHIDFLFWNCAEYIRIKVDKGCSIDLFFGA